VAANPESRMFVAANSVENQVSKINRMVRDIRKNNPDDPRIKLFEERKTEIMKNFLGRVDELLPN
jgi:uncharacterized protein YcbK (DUF882 family)